MLRDTVPSRSQVEERNDYKKYRAELREDFNRRCGYCDDSDEFTDRISFHIDHFAPKSKFQELANSYENLVYACRYCNVRKSNRWVGEDATIPNDGASGFVDPCQADYDLHLERTEDGSIIAKTEVGQYMVRHLNLHLLRHRALWEARRARKLRNEVEELIAQIKDSGDDELNEFKELLMAFYTLTKRIEDYEGLSR